MKKKNQSKGQNIYLEITWLNRTEEYINSLLLLLFYKIFLELFIKNESCFSHIQIPRTSFNVFLCSYFLLLLIKKKKLVLWRIENTWINCIALVLCGMEILECYKTHFSFCFFFFCGWIWIGIFFLFAKAIHNNKRWQNLWGAITQFLLLLLLLRCIYGRKSTDSPFFIALTTTLTGDSIFIYFTVIPSFMHKGERCLTRKVNHRLNMNIH